MRNADICECTIEADWEASMPLPEQQHAKQYVRILRALGHETQAPVQVDDGWVIYWKTK